MAEEQPDYLSYLLRLWRVSGDERSHRVGKKVIWRASLESSHVGGRKVFASLDDLFDFLREQTGEQAEDTMKEQPGYLSYLLRLRRVGDEGDSHRVGGKAVWRASLESVHTGEQRVFASLDDLFGFLREQAGLLPDF